MPKKDLSPSAPGAKLTATQIRLMSTPEGDFHFRVFGSFAPSLIPNRADNPMVGPPASAPRQTGNQTRGPQNQGILDPGFFRKGRMF